MTGEIRDKAFHIEAVSKQLQVHSINTASFTPAYC
jgi:hypothetical protein